MGTDELDSLLLVEEAQEASPGLFGSPLGAGASSSASGGSSPSHTAAGEQSAAKPKDKKASKGKVRVNCVFGYSLVHFLYILVHRKST